MSKTTIIFDANSLIGKRTGVGYLTHSLAKSLSERDDTEVVGHYFNFLNRKDVKNLAELPEVKFIKSTIFPTKVLNILRRLHIELPLELFTRRKADLLIFPNFTSMPSLFNTKNILFVHDLGFIDLPQFVSDANASFLRHFVPKSIRRASIIFTISNFTKERITEVYSPSKDITVIPVPPAKRFPSTAKSLEKLSIPDKYLLFIGTLEPRKNLSLLLDSLEQIHAETGVSLVLAGGKGWKDDEIIKKIDRLQIKGIPIISTGYVSDEEKAALYKNTDLYIQPSLYEGFGMPILEAMSYGAPILCSDIPVFREVAKDNVQYFDANDSKNLAEEAIKILQSKKTQKQLREKSKAAYRGYPTWDQVAKIIIDTYSKEE